MGKTRTIIIGEEVEGGKPVKPVAEKKPKPVKIAADSNELLKEVLGDEPKGASEATEDAKEEPAIKAEKSTPKKSLNKSRPKSKIYLKSKKQVDNKSYILSEAIALAKKTSYAKFDATIELHVGIISKKGQEALRGLVSLPAGSAKQKRIVVADDQIIEKVKQGKIDFDVLIATPAMMPKLAQVAKILGPKGMMPNPKSGTVTDDVEKVKAELSSGKVEYKTDPLGNIHLGIGKVSWDEKKLDANIAAVLQVIPKNRVGKVYLCATMGPAIQLSF